jgi:hypothetical protein
MDSNMALLEYTDQFSSGIISRLCFNLYKF